MENIWILFGKGKHKQHRLGLGSGSPSWVPTTITTLLSLFQNVLMNNETVRVKNLIYSDFCACNVCLHLVSSNPIYCKILKEFKVAFLSTSLLMSDSQLCVCVCVCVRRERERERELRRMRMCPKATMISATILASGCCCCWCYCDGCCCCCCCGRS